MEVYVFKADSGIIDLKISDIPLDDDISKSLDKFPKTLKDIIIEDMKRQVEFVHNGFNIEGDKIEVVFDLSQESKGTQKMFNWAGPFIDVLANGRLLVIDEFERSLHPLLVNFLLKYLIAPNIIKLARN